jgi:hypothetical protein
MPVNVFSSQTTDQTTVIAPNTISYGLVMDSAQNTGVVINKGDIVDEASGNNYYIYALICFIIFVSLIAILFVVYGKNKAFVKKSTFQ